MDNIKETLKNPVITGAAGFVLGILVGLVVLGWWLIPVKWTDASPADLTKNFQKDYLRSAVYAYSTDKDTGAAQARWNSLGESGKPILDELMMDPTINNQAIANFVTAIQGEAVVVPPVQGSTLLPGVTETPTATEEKKPLSNPLLLSILCILLIAIGVALVYMLFVRKKKLGDDVYEPRAQSYERVEQPDYQSGTSRMATGRPAAPAQPVQPQSAPVSQFMTTYTAGDDLYDDSFSIDSPTGEFLGECGVGISETIGVGDPKKVTAFEVWLFDKNDIQTVTKVVMSEHAWNDVAISQRLAAKGEPILMDSGKRVILETATLVLEARVVDVAYGQGALPPHSFFDRMTLELAIWTK